jgi:hypothetical protein
MVKDFNCNYVKSPNYPLPAIATSLLYGNFFALQQVVVDKEAKSNHQNQEDSYQNAVTEEKPTIDTMIQSEVRENPNCANRSAKPPSVPGDPTKSFILTGGGPAP